MLVTGGTDFGPLEAIAHMLGVGFSTIQRDLGDLPTAGTANPKGAGRPRGSGEKPRKPRKAPKRHDIGFFRFLGLYPLGVCPEFVINEGHA